MMIKIPLVHLDNLTEITFFLQKDASIITAPGSSHNEVEITPIEFFINDKHFLL